MARNRAGTPSVVRAAVLKNFSEVARSLGLNPDALLQQVGLSSSLIRDPERRIPLAATLALLENAAAQGQCDSFGLRMAESRQLSDFGVVSLLLSHQRTLRDALQTTILYRHLLNRSLLLDLRTEAGLVLIQEDIVSEPGTAKRQATDLAVAVLYRMCATLMGPQFSARSVNFSHAPASDSGIYSRLFRCRVQFDSAFDGFVVPAADLDAANPHADPTLALYARKFMDSMEQDPEGQHLFEVRKAIYLLLPMGRASVQQIAQSLGLSVRSLQRELDANGVAFSMLLNNIRRELALRYIETPRYRLEKIGELLGYSVPSSFSRWFTGEFGSAPRQYRQQVLSRAGQSPPHGD